MSAWLSANRSILTSSAALDARTIKRGEHKLTQQSRCFPIVRESESGGIIFTQEVASWTFTTK